MSSEDIDSSTHPETNSRGEDEPQPVLRVRVISEINSTEIADGAGSSPLKRRSIESPSETDDTTKKQKLETNSDQGAAPPSSMDAALPSTSSSNSNNQDGGKSAIAGSSSEPNGEHVNVVVKEEPADETPSGSNDPPTATAQLLPVKKEESSVKEEPTSSIRDSCQFGIRCYRNENKNPTQLRVLTEFMNKYPELRNLQQTSVAKKNIWQALTIVLNEYGPPAKSVEGWKEVWRDHKIHRNKKARNRRKRNKNANESGNTVIAARPTFRPRAPLPNGVLVKVKALAEALCASYETIYLGDEYDDCYIPSELVETEVIEIECDDDDDGDAVVVAAQATDDAAAEAMNDAAAVGATDSVTATENNDVTEAVLENPLAENIDSRVEYQKRMIEIFTERNSIERAKLELLREAEQDKVQYRKRKLEFREREIRALEERNRLDGSSA